MKNSLRSVARHLSLDALSITQSVRGLGESKGPLVQFVLLHHVKPAEESRFDQFLEWLTEHYRVVSYSDAVKGLSAAGQQENIAAISFDDGLKDNLAAARIMARHGVSGCFFVCPGIVGETDSQKVERYCHGRMLFSAVDEFMNWDDLNSLCESGHEIGNHSWNHYYMIDLPDSQFDEELLLARERLQAELGQGQHFAWPYGRFFHFKKQWVERTLRLGQASCASGERGSHLVEIPEVVGDESVCLRRDSLSMSWPLRHLKYFLNRSAHTPVSRDDAWPAQLASAVK